MTANVTELPVAKPAYNEEDLRGSVMKLRDEGMTLADMAKEAGIPYGSFTNWTNGTYGGKTQKIAGQVSQWLAARTERKTITAKIRINPGHIETPTSQAIDARLIYAQSMADMVEIIGPPGIGKSATSDNYQRNNPNVYMVTARESVNKPFSILDELAMVIGVTETRTSRLNRAIGMKLKDKKALIIVDEADQLTVKAINEMRSFVDIWNTGLALVGGIGLHALIHGNGRTGKTAQLSSRVSMVFKAHKSRPEDISAFASAYGILDPKVMRLVQRIGAQDGGLRAIAKTLRLAAISAAGGGEDALSEAAITAAYKELAHDTVA